VIASRGINDAQPPAPTRPDRNAQTRPLE